MAVCCQPSDRFVYLALVPVQSRGQCNVRNPIWVIHIILVYFSLWYGEQGAGKRNDYVDRHELDQTAGGRKTPT